MQNEQEQQAAMDNQANGGAANVATVGQGAPGAKPAGMTIEDLKKRDFILLVDRSGSMETTDCDGGKSRWETAKEGAEALAAECEKYDENGITVGTFNKKWTILENIKAGSKELHEIFAHNSPGGSTNTGGVLAEVLGAYLKGRPDAKPITLIVITDGQPDSEKDVIDAIVNASNKIEDENEIGISFVQVGKDGGARAFLQMLDDDLVSKHGAKFDIVDTIKDEDMNDMSLTQVLINAVMD